MSLKEFLRFSRYQVEIEQQSIAETLWNSKLLEGFLTDVF